MPVKRPHKKSRNGCDECRKRRVKCDEHLPRCSSCTARGETCHFPRQFTPKQRAKFCRSRSTPIPSQQESIGENEVQGKSNEEDLYTFQTNHGNEDHNAVDWKRDRRRELELMHHWCTRTSSSFSPQLAGVFREHVTHTALDCGYLLEALFALTALHMASETSDTAVARSYVSTALNYQNRTLSKLRETVHKISEANCEAFLLSSIIILCCAIVSPLLPAGNNEEAKSMVEVILPIAALLRGTSSVIASYREWLIQGTLGKIIEAQTQYFSTRVHEPSQSEKLHSLNDARMDADSNESLRKHEIFRDAISKLETRYSTNISVMPWLLDAGPEYMDALQKGEEMAVVIFMHWGVLLDRSHDMWWAKYSSRRLVKELAASLDERSDEWESATIWCRSQLGLLDGC